MTLLYIQNDPRPSCRRAALKCDDASSNKCLREWSTRHLYYNIDKENHTCRNCIRKRYALAGGKAAAAVGKENGQIRRWIMAAATPEARNKAYATARAKGKRAFTSKAEDAVFERCVEWFGDVKRWRYITSDDGKRFNVDFYIPSIKTYVEVDGVYWHGLDRAYEELHPDQRSKFDRDRLLDEHCRHNQIRLVRILDIEVKDNRWSEIQRRIVTGQ